MKKLVVVYILGAGTAFSLFPLMLGFLFWMSAPHLISSTLTIYEDPIGELQRVDHNEPPPTVELNDCVLCAEVGALLADLPDLKVVVVEYCSIEPGFWQALSTAPSLYRIRVARADGLSVQDAHWIASLPSLTEFGIYRGDGVCNDFVEVLSGSESLESLRIKRCSEVLLHELNVSPNLKRLEVWVAQPNETP
jgi:hypothetical protein